MNERESYSISSCGFINFFENVSNKFIEFHNATICPCEVPENLTSILARQYLTRLA